jgi:hypothetical protein
MKGTGCESSLERSVIANPGRTPIGSLARLQRVRGLTIIADCDSGEFPYPAPHFSAIFVPNGALAGPNLCAMTAPGN